VGLCPGGGGGGGGGGLWNGKEGGGGGGGVREWLRVIRSTRKDNEGVSALGCASVHGHVEAMRLLLGAQVRFGDSPKATATLAYTRYCHHQYCMVYGIKRGGR